MMKFLHWRILRLWPLALVPISLLILSRILLHMSGAFPDDPEYAYLLNGLEMLTFYPPSYSAHPGTNLITLTAILNLATWLVTLPFHRLGLVTDILTKSQFYLAVNNAILVMAIAAAAFWFADRVRRATGSIAAALAAQASLLVSFPVMVALNRVSPEPLQLAATLVLAGLLTPLAFGRSENIQWTAAAVGIVIGFCISAKITAVPLVAVLLLLPGWALRKRAAYFVAGGFVFFTLPAAHHYQHMLSWFTGMATHSGAYSGGPAGLPSAATLLSNAFYLFGQAPELFVAIAAYAAMALLGPRPLRRLMAVSALVVAAQILVVLKQPGPRYLVPVIAIFALANAAIVAALLSRGAAWSKAALAALAVIGLCNTAVSTAAWADRYRGTDIKNRKLLDMVSASGCAQVTYYEAPLILYDLDFGSQYSANRFSQALQRLYPRGFTYDIARNSFMFFGTSISPRELQARIAPATCIYLVGSPLERFGGNFPIPAEQLTLVAPAQFENDRSIAVYRYRP